MEIFVRPIPHGLGQPGLHKHLKYHLDSIGIYAFEVNIRRGRAGTPRVAFLTVPSKELGDKLLTKHGDLPPGVRRNGNRHLLNLGGRVLLFSASKSAPKNAFLVVGLLQKQKDEQIRRQERSRRKTTMIKRADKEFVINEVECGIWNPDPDPDGLLPEFIPRWSSGERLGSLHFRPNSIAIVLGAQDSGALERDKKHTLVIDGYTIGQISTDKHEEIFFSLYQSPKIYRHTPTISEEKLRFQNDIRQRVPGIDDEHQAYCGYSLVYRVVLSYQEDYNRLLTLSKKAGIPPIEPRTIRSVPPRVSFITSFQMLVGELQNSHVYPFPVAYQLHALFANGTIPPDSVIPLLPSVRTHMAIVGTDIMTEALKKFAKSFSSIDPLFHGADINSRQSLIEHLNRQVAELRITATPEWRAQRAHQKEKEALVYRSCITPTGVYSFGPSFEPLNRVLRKYRDFQDYFMRVTFSEEDTDSFHQEKGVDSSLIIEQFKERILSPLVIAGRHFRFLGFSSSSLKSTTCWFMANFLCGGKLMTPELLIQELGNFGDIRIPGRFAARVGQAFSDTTHSILVGFDEERDIEDIKHIDRSGVERNFSDGIGTVSWKMVQRIWDQSAEIARDRPTVFQIRYAGAKGVICLDPNLQGDQLCLRKSMVKFNGSTDRNIEICNWARKGPLCLNRPMIKVLEDRNVSPRTFMALQKSAVDKLIQSSRSPAQAANFFKRQNVSAPVLKLPWVIDVLQNLEIYFWNDPFLKQGLQLALAAALRSIKYKARIPVDKGVTLMGVLDESNYLREGQIYASFITEEGRTIQVRGRVLITRSPQYHPGDVQMVEAVDVPLYSPLRRLKNCVAFSQRGDRPLPSMLSGGDLDGDLYNIIWDPRFNITENVPSAEYESKQAPQLDRAVTLRDVGEFFVDFMQNNILGLIANRHLIISDQSLKGIHDDRCLKLAEMASTAVDFPKTGIKVTIQELPKADSHAKPDFLAPGPRAIVSRTDVLIAKNPLDVDPEEDGDEFGAPQVWYASTKALGSLYRAINEEKFLDEIKENMSITNQSSRAAVLSSIWEYMVEHTRGHADWHEYIDEAIQQRREYDYNMEDIMSDRSETPWKSSLTEIEVFMGTILGKNAFGRRNFDMTQQLRADYNGLASHTTNWMRSEEREETLGKAMASLFISLPDSGYENHEGGEMKSWAWVAISVLVAEVDQMQKDARKTANRRTTMRQHRPAT